MSDPADFINEDDFEEDEDLELGEVNLFGNIPWINEGIGSMLEAQLLRYNDPHQCRQCGKFDRNIENTGEHENGDLKRFCSEKCRDEWMAIFELRLAQGKHDLRTRGFD